MDFILGLLSSSKPQEKNTWSLAPQSFPLTWPYNRHLELPTEMRHIFFSLEKWSVSDTCRATYVSYKIPFRYLPYFSCAITHHHNCLIPVRSTKTALPWRSSWPEQAFAKVRKNSSERWLRNLTNSPIYRAPHEKKTFIPRQLFTQRS